MNGHAPDHSPTLNRKDVINLTGGSRLGDCLSLWCLVQGINHLWFVVQFFIDVILPLPCYQLKFDNSSNQRYIWVINATVWIHQVSNFQIVHQKDHHKIASYFNCWVLDKTTVVLQVIFRNVCSQKPIFHWIKIYWVLNDWYSDPEDGLDLLWRHALTWTHYGPCP